MSEEGVAPNNENGRDTPLGRDPAGALIRHAPGSPRHRPPAKGVPAAGPSKEYRLLYAAASALAEVDSLNEGLRGFLQASCAALGADYGSVWLVSPNGRRLRAEAVWHAQTPEMHTFATFSQALNLLPRTGPPGRVWATGVAYWIGDLTSGEEGQRQALAISAGLKHAYCAPVTVDGVVGAVVEYYWRAMARPSYPAHLRRLVDSLTPYLARFLQRTQAEYRLSESEQRWVTTLASIGDAVIATDAAGRITFMNPVAELLTGWTRREAINRPVGEVFSIVNEVTREHVQNPVDKVLHLGLIVGLANHTSLVRRDGSEVAIDDSGAPIRSGDGKLMGAVLIFRDVTERRQAERELRQNRDQLAVILQGVADGITAQAPDGRLVYANDAAAQVLGFASVHDLLGATATSVLGRYEILDEVGRPFDMQRLPGRVALRTGKTSTATVRFRVRDTGEEHWAIDRAVPVVDEQGRVEMAVNIFQDITKRIHAEEALRRQAALVDLSPDGIFVRRLDGTITFWSRGAEVMYGWTRQEALGRTTREVVQSRYPQPLEEIVAYLRKASQWVGELVQCTKDGQEIVVQSFWQAQFDEHGDVVEIMESNVDVTERVRSQEERQRLLAAETQARQEAERQNALRVRFLGMVSHELRTPLTAIKGFTTTLLAKDITWDAESQRDFLQTIDREADRLTDMIEQLLDLSRIESGTMRMEPADLTLGQLFDTALPELHTLTGAHRLTVQLPDPALQVRVDRQRTVQVLTNLVGNAAKYSPPGTAITVNAVDDGGDFVCISVSDQGPGIAPEDLPFVFEAFRRGSNGAARQSKGAGLGLAICKGIVEAHGGRIWFDTRTGPGTTVCFTLPVAR